eukprot:CAMPEP_0174963928 /NCGR_PEP_ID=MMETSP0004_2-20121128/5595_1 /TAXON_ID=420556 /ORGANISM="Ochromonas sp., Strain CCMP1393" /LENGTH=1175 /DNA_ID=CAMNT_0016212593 /DNA_START=146 /DNA_END=3673 /DNA_ORIENTATION=+
MSMSIRDRASESVADGSESRCDEEIEQTMYDAFMQELRIAEGLPVVAIDEEIGPRLGTQNCMVSGELPSKLLEIPAKSLVESGTDLMPNAILEIVYKGRIMFGNLLSRKSETSKALLVKLTSGMVITVDVAQVVSVWDSVADSQPPTNKLQWAAVTSEALQILRNMSPRKSDLREFWHLIGTRSSSVPVDSLDLGVYIFQESKFATWMNPYVTARASRVYALSAAQRYAAAILLYNDDIHFKRRPSSYAELQEEEEEEEEGHSVAMAMEAAGGAVTTIDLDALAEEEEEDELEQIFFMDEADEPYENNREDDSDGVVKEQEQQEGEEEEEEATVVMRIVEGGYKVLDESLALFRECEAFAAYYEDRVSSSAAAAATAATTAAASTAAASTSSTFRSSSITRLLRMLEMYALSVAPHSAAVTAVHGGPGGMADKATVAKEIRMLLKRLKLPVNPVGARTALLNMGYATSRSSSGNSYNNENNENGANSSSEDKSANERGFEPTFSQLQNIPRPPKKILPNDSKGAGAAQHDPLIEGYSINITPWGSDILEAAQTLQQDCSRRRQVLDETGVSPVGKKGPSGRMDYRADTQLHPPICIDTKYASFYDDAFSLSPSTGEILVHVADVAASLRRHEVLQAVAKDRISSTFLPSGPLHMLPPQALEALKLSSSGPNEVITVALSVDYDSGRVLAFRVFASVLGPVFPVDLSTANEIIAGIGVDDEEQGHEHEDEEVAFADSSNADTTTAAAAAVEAIDGATVTAATSTSTAEGKVKGHMFETTGSSRATSIRPGFPNEVVRDLRTAYKLVQKICAVQPWLDGNLLSKKHKFTEFSIDFKQRTVQSVESRSEYAHRLVNALLTLYSESSYRYCMSRKVPVPLAWENRDKIDNSRPRRFATQPLRNWISQLQQKQIRAAMKMELPLSRKECAMAVTHHNEKRKQQAAILGTSGTNSRRSNPTKHSRRRDDSHSSNTGTDLQFAAFEAHCAAVMNANLNIAAAIGEGINTNMEGELGEKAAVGEPCQQQHVEVEVDGRTRSSKETTVAAVGASIDAGTGISKLQKQADRVRVVLQAEGLGREDGLVRLQPFGLTAVLRPAVAAAVAAAAPSKETQHPVEHEEDVGDDEEEEERLLKENVREGVPAVALLAKGEVVDVVVEAFVPETRNIEVSLIVDKSNTSDN